MTYTVYGDNGDLNGFRHYDSIVKARAYALCKLKDGYKNRAKNGGFVAPNIEIRNSAYMPIGVVGMGTVQAKDGGHNLDPKWFFYSEYSTSTREHRAYILKSDGTLGKRLE